MEENTIQKKINSLGSCFSEGDSALTCPPAASMRGGLSPTTSMPTMSFGLGSGSASGICSTAISFSASADVRVAVWWAEDYSIAATETTRE